MIRPLLLYGIIHIRQRGIGRAVFLDALFTVIIRHQARDLGHPALGIHGDGGVSALYPEIDPFVICRAVAAVHENNARHLIFRARPLWNTDKGKYFGILHAV